MFLKGDKTTKVGEIDEYANIEIEWKRGKRAIMTIFDDNDKQLEEIKLYELQTRDEMHKLMTDKGFVKKTKSQKAAEVQINRMEAMHKAQPSMFGSLASVYFMVFGLIVGGFYVRFAVKQRRKARRCAAGHS